MIFNVLIEETVSQEFEIEADTLDEAKEITRKKYLGGEFVLEPGDMEAAQMKVFDEKYNCLNDWEEI